MAKAKKSKTHGRDPKKPDHTLCKRAIAPYFRMTESVEHIDCAQCHDRLREDEVPKSRNEPA